MRLKEITLVLLIVGGIVHESFAQVRNPGGSRGRYTTPKVRGHKAKIICPVFEASPYPSHGFGFKLGDPFALTYKFYPNKRFSFAVDVGRPASGSYTMALIKEMS